MQSDRVSCLLCYDVVELTCKVFTWEGEILGKHNLAKDVFSVGLLKFGLILVCKHLLDTFRFKQNKLIQQEDQFKELSSERIHFHNYGVG